jgi:hypothetical protein
MRLPSDTLAAILLWSLAACASDPLAELPPVASLSDTGGTVFHWPWCAWEIPPLYDCGEWGSVSDIGVHVSEQQVCTLVGALRASLSEAKWSEIAEVQVCRVRMAPRDRVPHDAAEKPNSRDDRTRTTRLYVYLRLLPVMERRIVKGVEMIALDTETGEVSWWY